MNKLVWHPVLRLPLDQDLGPFLLHLNKLQILSHVTEEQGQQQLWISDESRRLEVANLLSDWLSGEVQLQTDDEIVNAEQQQEIITPTTFQLIFKQISLAPFTFGMILLGFLGTLAIFTETRNLTYAQPFIFQAVKEGAFLSLYETLSLGEYWRLVTPVFLHFSLLHIIFNSLFLWVIGRRIEIAKGMPHMLFVFVVVAVISNLAQYWVRPDTIFGGLSGVVYGVIGYIAVYQHYLPHPVLHFNKAAIAFFIIWLLLGVFGIIDFFISGSIANAAHIIGLASGAVIGFLVVLKDNKSSVK